MVRRRSAAPVALALVLVVSGCAPAARTTSPSSAAPSSSAPTSPAASETVAVPSTPPQASTPPTSPPFATPNGPPDAGAFWARVQDGIYVGGGDRLRIDVAGAAPGELRFQKGASATVIDGALVFVCVGGRAYDGQSGFVDVPGDWVCGGDALVNGLRTAGQPVDAWSEDLPLDRDRSESYSLAPTGDWRWDYRATNPILGPGQIRTTVIMSAETGRILALTRFDPLGETVYRLVYEASFPDIVKP